MAKKKLFDPTNIENIAGTIRDYLPLDKENSVKYKTAELAGKVNKACETRFEAGRGVGQKEGKGLREGEIREALGNNVVTDTQIPTGTTAWNGEEVLKGKAAVTAADSTFTVTSASKPEYIPERTPENQETIPAYIAMSAGVDTYHYFEDGSRFRVERPASDFGNAEAKHVLCNKTFTSSSGIDITGEMQYATRKEDSEAPVTEGLEFDGIDTTKITLTAGYTPVTTIGLDNTIKNQVAEQNTKIQELLAKINTLPDTRDSTSYLAGYNKGYDEGYGRGEHDGEADGYYLALSTLYYEPLLEQSLASEVITFDTPTDWQMAKEFAYPEATYKNFYQIVAIAATHQSSEQVIYTITNSSIKCYVNIYAKITEQWSGKVMYRKWGVPPQGTSSFSQYALDQNIWNWKYEILGVNFINYD